MNKTNKKVRIGTVVSTKMDKSVVVMTDTRHRHPVIGKIIKKQRKFVAHDEKNECQSGDTVKIIEARPMSKTKRWVLLEIMKRAEVQ